MEDNEELEENQHHEHADRGFIKGIMLEFPRFSGQDPSAWIYRANQYFLYHQVPPAQCIFIASSIWTIRL